MKTQGRDGMTKDAIVTDDGLYRYVLGRRWADGPTMTFVMLNPSTADDVIDDPTIRRCMGFARREHLGGIEVINLFALRTTKPEHLGHHPEPEGVWNREAWDIVLSHPGPVVAAWGHGAGMAKNGGMESAALDHYLGRVDWVCLGKTRSMAPCHPLYLRADAPLEPWP